ncbi:MAG: hypothetical protein HYZ49_14650 [Chloroflexi bacterium]|nr:hypothetical protein [Chloroflexota bacterium]
MNTEGPLLETLTRRLAECPAEFLAEPRLGKSGQVHVAAVVSDLLTSLGGPPLSKDEAVLFQRTDAKKHRNHYSVVLIACWLLHDAWFRERGQFAETARQLLFTGLDELAGLIRAPQLVSDPDRREEFSRLCLSALNLRPAGETAAQALDRLTTLNTAERQRVIAAARAAEARAQEIREAMAGKAAEEAADKWSRE